MHGLESYGALRRRQPWGLAVAAARRGPKSAHSGLEPEADLVVRARGGWPGPGKGGGWGGGGGGGLFLLTHSSLLVFLFLSSWFSYFFSILLSR